MIYVKYVSFHPGNEIIIVTFAQVPADDAHLEEQHEPGGGVVNQEL